jgi:putative transposase
MAQHVRNAVVAKRGALSGWDRGPVLAPWPTREIVGDLASDLRGRATAICVILWGTDPLLTAWLRARRAVSVVDGSVHPEADEPLLEPVVEAAMTELCDWALGHGFTGAEEDRLRQYATKVLEGSTFRPLPTDPFSPGAVQRWQDQASYSAAHREVMPSVEHRSHKGLNNRAENSHQPARQRERAMKGFHSTGAAQRFLSAFSGISPHFRPHRHLLPAHDYRAEMTIRFTIWEQVTGVSGLSTMA